MSKVTHVGELIVWNFAGWNVGVGDQDAITDVLCMDLPNKKAAVELAELHQQGRVNLREHEYFDHDARVAGSRGWGSYAAIYSHTSRCSCGWSAETESKVEGRKDRADHIKESAS